MNIFLDGSVVPCCYDDQGKIIFGNIFKQDVLEIWNSPISFNFRSNVHKGNPPQFCLDNCLLYNYDPNNIRKIKE